MTESTECLVMKSASCAPLSEIPVVDFKTFGEWILHELKWESRVCALFAEPTDAGARLYVILARDKDGTIALLSTDVEDKYPSLTQTFPAMHLFEREIYEEYGIIPQAHPWLKPVRFNQEDSPQVGVMDYYTVEGDEVHEVGVGPIHAGIIECGHFRFQCQGEVVMHLEISLGYNHRGIEQACEGEITSKTLPIMEVIAGDSTVAHSWAYCSNIEALSGVNVPLRGQLIRAVALELERLANHTGDLGAIAGDIGYLPTSSFCGRLRGDYLNLTALICGNRFGRSLLTLGGVKHNITAELAKNIVTKLLETYKDTLGATKLLWKTNSVTARMIGRGILRTQSVQEFSMVGPTARASGVRRDARVSHPLPHLQKHDFTMQVSNLGGVYSRAKIREDEIVESVQFIKRILSQLSEGDICSSQLSCTKNSKERKDKLHPPLEKSSIAVSLVEGWRGEVCHIAVTDDKGGISSYKVVDPSFHNWIGLALAMRLQQISDFPLCNKSFNLSYCGHDL